MIKFAKIINEETKLCEVGLGTNEKFYKSIGMTELDVEQAYNGFWYITGYAPKKPIDEARDEKKTEAEQALTQKIAEITPYYPTDEKVSFSKQEDEALKYKANPSIDVSEIPCIYGISTGRQIELALLVEKILNKAALFSRLSGLYMGRKQRIEDLADQAQTVEEIEAIDVQAIFNEPIA